MEKIFRNHFSQISEHPELNTESFYLYEHAPWDLHKLSHHPNFKLEWMREIYDWDHDKDYYPSQWDFDVISQHPDLNDDFLFNEYDVFYENELNFKLLSQHPNFKAGWMNRYIGANWDLDYIVQRSDFSSDDLLTVFVKPNQKWNYNLIAKRYGQEWSIIFFKVQNKLLDSLIKFIDKAYCPSQYKESVKKWFDPAFHRIVNFKNGGWNDYDDEDNFDLDHYFENHKTFAADIFKKQMRHYQLKKDLLPVAWHPDRVIDWCFDEDEKKDLHILWGE